MGPETDPDRSSVEGKSLGQLVQALHDSVAWNRVRAAYWLSQANAPAQAVPALAKALQDEEAFVRWAAAFALSLIGAASEAALPALIEALKDEEENVRSQALDALNKIESGATVAGSALDAVLQVPSLRFRVAAAAAHWRRDRQPEKVLPILTEALNRGDKHTRRTAAHALADVGPAAAAFVPALIAALEDSDRDMHVSAAFALCDIGAPEAVRARFQPLQACLDETSAYLDGGAPLERWQETSTRPERTQQASSEMKHDHPNAFEA